MLQILLIQGNKAQFFYSGLNQKLCDCKRALYRKIEGFHPYFIIQVVRNFPKVIYHSCISMFKLLSFLTNYWFHFFHQGLNRKLHTCGGGFDWEIFSCDLCVKFQVVQNFQEKSFNLHSSRLSNSNF